MRNIPILVLETGIAVTFVIIGLSGQRVLFIQGPRAATITLGMIGMLLCTLSVGKFISSAPAHPFSILGYIFGSIALLAVLTQLFQWNVPYIKNPQASLIVLAIALFAKSVIARFGYLIAK